MDIIPSYFIVASCLFLVTLGIGFILILCADDFKKPKSEQTFIHKHLHIVGKTSLIYIVIIYPCIFVWVFLTRLSYLISMM